MDTATHRFKVGDLIRHPRIHGLVQGLVIGIAKGHYRVQVDSMVKEPMTSIIDRHWILDCNEIIDRVLNKYQNEDS